MDERYRKFAEEGVRELSGYNRTVSGRGEEDMVMPQVVIIIDELADLMMAAPSQVEESICRLAQKARAAGMQSDSSYAETVRRRHNRSHKGQYTVKDSIRCIVTV